MEFINYLITDPKYYSDEKEKFSEVLDNSLQKHNVSVASFRDKQSSNIEELAQVFLTICKKHNIEKKILNSDIELALKLNFDGVHLTSKQFDKIKECKEKGLFVIISCHDLDEASKAYELGADAITYSPIFYTPFKGKPKGCEALKSLVEKLDIKREFFIIALGGIIALEQIEQIKTTGANGFASIRYFID